MDWHSRGGVVFGRSRSRRCAVRQRGFMMGTSLARLLLEEPSPVFALLDGAKDRSTARFLRASGLLHRSLYEGAEGEDLAPFGPYLVALPKALGVVETVVEARWGLASACFLASPAPFGDVRQHLRRFLEVLQEGGQKVLFRFYDPRVLRLFLPSVTHEEWMTFFGPIESFWVESKDPRTALVFRRDADEPEPARVALGGIDVSAAP